MWASGNSFPLDTTRTHFPQMTKTQGEPKDWDMTEIEHWNLFISEGSVVLEDSVLMALNINNQVPRTSS